ncbi:hypothetical protein ACJZ2D_009852 [Fusarium nematophilum]
MAKTVEGLYQTVEGQHKEQQKGQQVAQTEASPDLQRQEDTEQWPSTQPDEDIIASQVFSPEECMESQLPAEEPRAALADLEQDPGAQQEGRAQGSSPGFQMETSPAASPAALCPEEDDSSTAGTRLPTLQELFSSTDSRTVIDLTESNDPMAHPARKRPASSGESTKDTRKAKRQATCGQKKSTKEPPSFIPISFKADVEGIPVEFIWKQRAKGWIDQRDGKKRPVAEFILRCLIVHVRQ